MTGLATNLARALLIVLLFAGVAQAVPGEPARDELVLGRVSDDPKSDYARLKPLLDYVVPRMADVGIRRGRVLMARDNQQMISYLRRGKVDWLTETAGAAVAYQERGGARLLLLSERNGMPSYRTVFFARRDGPVHALKDLRGRTVAFQSPASTSAYFVPATEIVNAGMPLVIVASGGADKPGRDMVGFVFARSELNISTWVHKGLVDAGAFSDQDWADLERLPEPFRGDLVVFHRTGPMPRALELVRSDLDAGIEKRLVQVLLDAIHDPLAGAALERYWRTTNFRRPDATTLASLDQLRDGVRRIRAEVE